MRVLKSRLLQFSNLHTVSLYLGSNKITGSLPTQIGSIASLGEYGIKFIINNLCKTTTHMINIMFTETLLLNNNTFVGTIPTELGNLKKLRELFLGKYDFVLFYCFLYMLHF